jgi:hypothetical protein
MVRRRQLKHANVPICQLEFHKDYTEIESGPQRWDTRRPKCALISLRPSNIPHEQSRNLTQTSKIKCRQRKHVTVPLPSTNTTRTILKLNPDFKGEMSVTKHALVQLYHKSHANSEMKVLHSAIRWRWLSNTNPARSTLGLNLGFHGTKPPELWHSRQPGRTMWQKSWPERTGHDRFTSEGNFFYVHLLSYLLRSPTFTSQAVWTPQPCDSRHGNLNTLTEIWTLISEP